ncbi:protein kinase superfamily protein [Striga asiatica]|uniref:Protein kinase superfamily protein n=1 Tax=Striga asiatica TaxID=4170 RepID=A0A5A7QI17_STRAF|nr:protein kinase superfamily protein [Striga asiatica]
MENFQEVKMGREDNADSKWGKKKMEADESVRTVDCLRGRLLAERVASRNANMEAEQLGAKLMELENQLKQEAKSRNRAEKKLRFLMKKLQSMNISHASDESEYSGLGGKSGISSPSSTASLSTQESKQNGKSEKGPQNLHPKSYAHNILSSAGDDNSSSSTTEGSSGCVYEGILAEVKKGKECEIGHIENPRFQGASEDFEKKNVAQIAVENFFDICYASFRFSTNDCLKEEDDQDEVNNTMALVAVDQMPQKNPAIDPQVLDSTVKQVLDALRQAREQLQSSIEKRRLNMIRVG